MFTLYHRNYTFPHDNYPILSLVIITVAVIVSSPPLDSDLSTLGLVEDLEGAALDKTTGQGKGREIVLVAHVSKADDAVHSDTIDEADDGWKHLNLQLLNEEGRLLGVEEDELGLGVRSSYLSQVHVYDLAPLEVLMIEVAHHELATSHVGQELLLGDLGVLSVALDEVLLLLLVDVLHLCHPSLSNVSHDLLLFFPESVVIVVLVLPVVVTVVMHQAALVRQVVQVPLLILEFLLDLDGLVLDGLLHDHVREDLRGHLLHR